MENISNISSEEELMQLRNEGKVSKSEYHELLNAVRKAPSKDAAKSELEADKSEWKRKCGKIALTLMLLGLILPTVSFLALDMLAPENARPAISPFFFLGLALEIAAFVLGILAWPNNFARATVITIATIVAVALLFKLVFNA